MDKNVSNLIRELSKEKNITLASLANRCDVSVQCLYKWLSKSDNNWSLSSLMLLSEVLDFKIIVNEGEISVMKNTEYVNKKEESNGEEYKNVYRDFGEYKIVEVYVPNKVLSYDEWPDVLDELLVFPSKEECEKYCPESTAIKYYGLLEVESNSLYDGLSVYPYDIEGSYFKYTAPTIDTTEDGYEIVYEFKQEGIKVVRAGIIISDYSLHSGNLEKAINQDLYKYSKPLTLEEEMELLEKDKYYIGRGLTLLDSNAPNNHMSFISWSQNIDCLYFKSPKLRKSSFLDYRYFDRNRNEIFEGDILVKKDRIEEKDESEELYHPEKEINRVFKKGESIRVYKAYKDGIAHLIFNFEGARYTLNYLDLLMWEKVAD